jgi:hypothetical protein
LIRKAVPTFRNAAFGGARFDPKSGSHFSERALVGLARIPDGG